MARMLSKVALERIPSLTFYKDELTLSKRGGPIPQLTCVGKTCNLYQPDVVRCTNAGGRGTDVDWKCEADLPEALRFGRVEVSCEGWSGPGDSHVVKGSCGLEYRLVQIPDALRRPEEHLHHSRILNWIEGTLGPLMLAWISRRIQRHGRTHPLPSSLSSGRHAFSSSYTVFSNHALEVGLVAAHRLLAHGPVLQVMVQGRGGSVVEEALLPTRTTHLPRIPSTLQGRHQVWAPQQEVADSTRDSGQALHWEGSVPTFSTTASVNESGSASTRDRPPMTGSTTSCFVRHRRLRLGRRSGIRGAGLDDVPHSARMIVGRARLALAR
ncbi:DUF1183-domain-containing protein [Daedalea quercina L-15889]|uniref:Store-operated calcium entry-associated regulatory factor n=1 Tax=Daedalea quercina L-15889 TaxID=1314783 RepID=A0A165TIU1_9APHY|nr:DUF1183-domain-containing protein [Daedalea quercina L-15889]